MENIEKDDFEKMTQSSLNSHKTIVQLFPHIFITARRFIASVPKQAHFVKMFLEILTDAITRDTSELSGPSAVY